ncbi:MAG: helix-turn-helix transcriptional regulator [Bradymonadia bacterium]
MSSWTFLSNHAHVLLSLHQDHDLRMRDLALKVGITERAVQRIIHELVEENYVTVNRIGRRNHYEPNLNATLRHPLESGVTIAQFFDGLTKED